MKSLSIHLTDQCNNSCEFCVVNSSKKTRERVQTKIIRQFLLNNIDKGYDTVNIHGGEPTMKDEFLEILDLIQECGYTSVSLQTNARKLADKEFARAVSDKGVNLFVVSLHGHNGPLHDAITGEDGSFDEAIQGIKNVVELGNQVRTNTVVCKRNLSNIVDTVKVSMDLGTQHINISAIHPTGKAYTNFHQVTPRYSDIMSEVKAAVDACTKEGVVCTLEGFPYCALGDYTKYMIHWDEKEYKLLFHNTIMNNYADFMNNETKYKGEVCQECPDIEVCGGVYKEYIMFYDWDEFVHA